jgi:hypothetical protein
VSLQGTVQAEFGGKLRRLGPLQALRRVDCQFQDLFRRTGRYVFDILAARAQGHERHPADRTVDQQGQVAFPLGVAGLFDVDVLDRPAFGAGLAGDQAGPQ